MTSRRLTSCRTCGGDVARSANVCPSCGARRTIVGNAVALAGLIALLVAIAVVVLYAAGHAP